MTVSTSWSQIVWTVAWHWRFRSWSCYAYGRQRSQFIEFGTQICNPLTSNFSLQYHPWVTHKRHEKKGNDHQQKKLLTFIPILLVSTFGYMSCIRQTWKFLAKLLRFVSCDVVPLWGLLTHGNVMIKSWINRQSTHQNSNLFFQGKTMPPLFLMLESWILLRVFHKHLTVESKSWHRSF